MTNDNTEELIRQIQKTRQELASSLYQDFFSNELSADMNSAADGKSDSGKAADPVKNEETADGSVPDTETTSDGSADAARKSGHTIRGFSGKADTGDRT